MLLMLTECLSVTLSLCTEVVDSVIGGVAVRITTFDPTERMSTYLLAFIVCDFAYIQSTENDKLLVRKWLRKSIISCF